jgi:hypothetical protein
MMKKIAQFTLILFSLGAICFWAWEKLSTPSTTTALEQSAGIQTDQTEPAQSQPAVVVTYFTTDVRCQSCLLIESLTRQTLEEQFSQELASGTLRFETLNLDEESNKHFAQEYDLAFKTVVVSTEQNGTITHWQKLDDVWTLLKDPEAFKTYVVTPIHSILDSES